MSCVSDCLPCSFRRWRWREGSCILWQTDILTDGLALSALYILFRHNCPEGSLLFHSMRVNEQFIGNVYYIWPFKIPHNFTSTCGFYCISFLFPEPRVLKVSSIWTPRWTEMAKGKSHQVRPLWVTLWLPSVVSRRPPSLARVRRSGGTDSG